VAKRWTHRECFEHFDTIPKNPRWSWSARSTDGTRVAVTFWQDRFEERGSIYRSAAHSGDSKWLGSPGHKELLENLLWSKENCDGLLHLIIAIPRDPHAEPRAIKECFPQDRFRMRIVSVDAKNGDFLTERVPT
jgi:hypothetical protein